VFPIWSATPPARRHLQRHGLSRHRPRLQLRAHLL